MGEKNDDAISGAALKEMEPEYPVKRALVVDPSALSRSAILIFLQRRGWEALGVADGAEALLLVGTWYFDLVLTDPNPSKVSGLRFVRVVKAQSVSPEVSVILLVDENRGDSEADKLADGVLVKNDGLEQQLRAKLEQLCTGETQQPAQKLLDKGPLPPTTPSGVSLKS
jgi:CheY-like chemotaxis protein